MKGQGKYEEDEFSILIKALDEYLKKKILTNLMNNPNVMIIQWILG